MRWDEVPQDDAGVLAGHRELTYAKSADGRFVAVPCVGWDPANAANLQEWNRLDAVVTATADRVRGGLVSPLAYWMDLVQMDVALTAAYARLWRWRVRRHLRPAVFAGLPTSILARYAQTFGISVEQLRGLPNPVILPSHRRDQQTQAP